MKSQTLLSVGTVIFTLFVGSAMAADKTIKAGVVNDPLSTERNPGPPALSPAETRTVQEQQGTQLQQNGNQNSGSQNNGALGTVPLDNGGASSYPQAQPAPTTNPNGTTLPANQPGNAPPASTVPSVPVQPATGNPGVQ